MDVQKLCASTELGYAPLFLPVGNLRGVSSGPIQPNTQQPRPMMQVPLFPAVIESKMSKPKDHTPPKRAKRKPRK